MKSFAHVIADSEGLHARSCVRIVHEASKWACSITVAFDGNEADAKRMASLLTLRAVEGDTLEVRCDGADEAEAATALEAMMRMSI